MNNIKMLYYHRINSSAEIDINKPSVSKECDICDYWHFLNKGIKFQRYVCNKYCYFNPIQDEPFQGCSQMDGGGNKVSPL